METKKILPIEIRKIINGHDFIQVLQFYLGITQGKDIFARSLYSSLEYDKLKKEDMFKQILSLYT